MLVQLSKILIKKHPHLRITYSSRRNLSTWAQEEHISIYYNVKIKDSANHWVMTLYNDRISWARWESQNFYGYDTEVTFIAPIDPSYLQSLEDIIQKTVAQVRRCYQC